MDFYCHKAKLIIEMDGSIHDDPGVKQTDAIRQKSIENDGIKVVRFTNKEVLNNIELVLQRIKSLLNAINSSL